MSALEAPAARLAAAPAGAVVAIGWTDLRREPDVASELVSQALFGEPLEVLGRSADGRWLSARGEDGYAGWVRTLAVAGGPAGAVTAWRAAATHHLDRVLAWRRDRAGGPLPFAARLAPDAAGGWRGPLGPVGLAPADARAVRPAPPAGAARPARAALVRTARLFLGVPYLWGGRSPLGLDCSGFVQLVYGAAGVALPRDARDQCTRLGGIACLRRWPGGPPLRACADGAQARGRAGRPAAGDLLFFGPASGAVTHVALSLGGLRVVHAFGSVREAGLDPAGPDFEAELFENFLGFGSASRLAPGTPSGEST